MTGLLIGMQKNLFNFAYSLTMNRDDAQDLLQATSLKVLSNVEKLVHYETISVFSVGFSRHYPGTQLLQQDGSSPRFTEEDLQLFQNGTDPYGHPNTVWTDYIFRTGFMHKHNLNVSGGTTRCVWPTNMKTSDSRYLSRRIWGAR